MSIPEPPPDEARDPVDLWVRALIPAAVGLVFVAVLVAEPGPARFDLQLVAPRVAEPGSTIPVRAHLMTAGQEPPQVIDAPVVVDLRAPRGGPPLAQADLAASALFGVEGSLRVPPEARGELVLAGRASLAEEDAFVSRRLRVDEDAPPLPRHGRLQTDLQRYVLGPVQGPAPPDRLDARVVGGDCSGPGPCRLLVWVGRPAAAVRLVEAQGAEVLPHPECDGERVSSGVVACTVQATNNEASVVVAAYRDGGEVGRRSVQLPMGSAAPALERSASITQGEVSLEVARRYEEGALIVDVFHEDRWRRSVTLAAGSHVVQLDEPGLWRVQARSDPFGGGDVATRLVVVAPSDQAALDALARHPRQRDWLDPMAVALRRGDLPCPEIEAAPGPCAAARWASFMLTAGELEVVALPTYTSGAAQTNAGLHDRGQIRRAWAAALILLAGLFVAIVVLRRGLRASRLAERLLEEADAPHHQRPWTVWGSAVFVALVFLVAAMLVLSRGCL